MIVLGTKSSEIYELNYIRAICTLGVFLFHFSCDNTTVIPGTYINANHFLGTIYNCCFFMLSGYLIDRKYSKGIDTKQFYISKFKSILPLYWIAWCVCLILEYFTVDPVIFSRAPLYRMIYTFLGLDGMLIGRISTFYIVGEWFTGIIILCYVFYPFVNKVIRKNKGLFLTLITFFMISIVQRKYNLFNITFLNQSFTVSFLEFLIGILLQRTKKYWDNGYFLCACFILFEVFYFIKIEYYLYIFIYIHSICFFILIYNLGKFLKKYKRINKFISFFSKHSYGFFLLHHVALRLAISITLPKRIITNITVCIITFVICLVLAYLIIEIKNKIFTLSNYRKNIMFIISILFIVVLFCTINSVFLKNLKISKEQQANYKTVENSITYNVDNAYLTRTGVYMDGWAFVTDYNSNNYDIGIIVNNDIYLAKKVIRKDVKDFYSLKNIRVGFSIALDNNEYYEICVVDQRNKIIYK